MNFLKTKLTAVKNAIAATDPDQMFAYSTPKIVVIRDRYLGILHISFQIAIFIYIIIYQVIILRGYMNYEEPFGTVRGSLQRPSVLSNLSELAYCRQNATSDSLADCVAWDRFEVVYPPVRPGTFFITTRVTETTYELPENCTYPPMSAECTAARVGAPSTHYVGDIENFTLLIAHAVYGRQTKVTESNICMDGYMAYPESNEDRGSRKYIKRYRRSNNTRVCPDAAQTDESDYADDGDAPFIDRGVLPGDVMTVNELLVASSLDKGLDVQSDIIDASNAVKPTLFVYAISSLCFGLLKRKTFVKNQNNSIRYDGAVLMFFVDYSNRISKPNELKYRYLIHRVPRIDIKSEETIHTDFGRKYIVRNRHGLLLVFVQIGQIGVFSFQKMLTTIVAGAVLLSVAATIVDFIAFTFMAKKERYKKHKYELTEDFSDIRAEELAQYRASLQPTMRRHNPNA